MSENYTPSGKRTERVGGNARGGKHEDEVLTLSPRLAFLQSSLQYAPGHLIPRLLQSPQTKAADIPPLARFQLSG